MDAGSARGPEVVFAGVSLVRGNTRVLDNVSFTIAPDTIHAVIGPNGGGKSSLVCALLGQMRHSGTITINWADNNHTIGYVPQVVAIDKAMPLTVLDFITLCVQNRPAVFGVRKKLEHAVKSVLAEVGMAGKDRSLFSNLSGGERQRVLFAQAMIPTPRLLILDEPMNSLDREGARILSDKIKTLAAAGSTVLWVHHDIARVRADANAVSGLRSRLLFSGTPEKVLTEGNILEMFASETGV